MMELRLNCKQVPCFDLVEVSLPLTRTYDNPFDPREVTVDGFFYGPHGRQMALPGFLYQECERRLAGPEPGAPERAALPREVIQPTGEPCWKVRFTPTVPGTWQVMVRVRDRAVGEEKSLSETFTATAATVPPSPGASGFIRRAPGTDYFCFDDGTPFFPIGENIAWTGPRGTYDMDDWLPAAGRAGMNLARIWLQWINDVFSIEHKGSGAGRYDLTNAWRVDYVLDLARRSGLRVFFTLDSPEPYTKEMWWLGRLTHRPWQDCPYNAANGGPLVEPEEFYTTGEGHRLIRQRLRYIVARWGWDPNIFCWELWNELNCFTGWEKLVPEIAQWHIEMAGVLRALDPYGRLISTSFYNAEGHDDIWKLPELDFVQSHVYGPTDMALDLPLATRTMKARYRRPHIIGEFGPPLKPEFMDLSRLDPQGVHLHNALWSSVLSGGAGTALSWWWDSYVHPNDLYGIFTGLARFCEGVPWTTAGFQPLQASAGLRTGAHPDVRSIGLVGQGLALLWVQNALHTFAAVSEQQAAPAIAGARVVVEGMPTGPVTVEWWDTATGTITSTTTEHATAAGLALDIGELATDIACKIRW